MPVWIRRFIAEFRARLQGRGDRKHHLPVDDPAAIPANLEYWRERGQAHLDALAAKAVERDGSLKAKWCGLDRAWIAADKLEAEAREDQTAAEERLSSRDREQDRDVARRRQADLDQPAMGRVGARLALSVAVVGELFTVAASFVATDLPLPVVALMALATMVTLVMGAHQLGILARTEKRTKEQDVAVKSLLILPVVVAAVLGAFRIALIGRLGGEGVAPWAAAVGLGLLNVVFFAVAAIASFLSHRPGQLDVAHARAEVSKARRKVRTRSRRTTALAQRAGRAASRRQKAWEAAERVIEAHRQFYEGVRRRYVASFMRKYDGPVVPAALRSKNITPIQIPRPFQEGLDWSCPDHEHREGEEPRYPHANRLRPRATVLPALLSSLALGGCGESADLFILSLVDTTCSTASQTVREQYQAQFETRVLPYLQEEGGRLLVGIIDDNSANPSFAVDATFDPYNPATDRPLSDPQEQEGVAEEVRRRLAEALAAPAQQCGTDILGGISQMSRILATAPADAQRYLLIWSDGVQVSSELSLLGQGLTEREVNAFISEQKETGRLPRLDSVQVYVIGVGQQRSGTVTPERLAALERFWTAFIKASGGSLPSHRFVPALHTFP